MGSLRSLNRARYEKKEPLKTLFIDLHSEGSLEVKDVLDASIFRSVAYVDLVTFSFDSTSPTIGYMSLYQEIGQGDGAILIPSLRFMHLSKGYTKILSLKIKAKTSLLQQKMNRFILFLREDMRFDIAVTGQSPKNKARRKASRTLKKVMYYYGLS